MRRRRRSAVKGPLPLYYRLALRHSRKLAEEIIAEHSLGRRTMRTLPFFIMAEGLDMRTAQLRRISGQRRSAGYMLRKRWAERCDENPALERAIYDAAQALKAQAAS